MKSENSFTFKLFILKNTKLLATLVILSVILTAGCKKDLFVETAGLCPLVVSTNPINLATGVPLNQVITATFNVPINPATVTLTSFTISGSAAIAGTITYAGLTASFTPTSPLLPNTTYTGRITTAVKEMKGNALQADYVWSFSTGATVAPIVISTDPLNLATGVVINKTVAATFSVPMNPTSINGTSFYLKEGANLIPGLVTYSGSTAYFKSTINLVAGTLYTATITTVAKNLAGTTLASNYVWTFTTGSLQAPTVIVTDPLNLATNVLLSKVITAGFSEAMNPSTINASSFTLMNGSVSVAGTVTYAGTVASFTPTVALLPSTLYTATITTTATNVAGTALASNYVWTFTTGILVVPTVISTDPANLATGVPLNKVITATFSEPMNASTITNSSFLVKLGSVTVPGTVTYAGVIASFTPTSLLLSDSTYTCTITTLAKNLAGTPIASNYVWTFSTKLHTGPLPIDLKSVGRFGIIAGVGVSNNAGQSEIHDQDVGISPGVRSSVTGFPPAIIVNGAIYASDDIAPPGVAAMLIQAKQDLTDAYLAAEGATSPAPALVAGDLGGQTLAPGIYKSTSTLLVQSGSLTLDAQGDVNAVWIFQIAAGFTTVGGAGGNIILSGGAQAKNIFWQVGSSATIGDFTSFKGNVLALTSITMNSGATAVGRMLARNGAVVMTSTNIINKP